MFASLKQAMSFNFLIVAVVPILFFGLVAIQLMHAHQLKGLRELNMAHAVDVSDEASEFLREVMFDLLLVADAVSMEKLVAPRNIGDYLQLTVGNSQFLESIYLVGPDQRVVNVGLAPRLSGRRPQYESLDLSGHQIFRDHHTIREPIWSNVFVSPVTGDPSITLAVPSGRNYIFGNINLQSLSRLLQRYSVGRNTAFAIVGTDGALVAHSDPHKLLQGTDFLDHPIVSAGLAGKEKTVEHCHDPDRKILESVTRISTTNWLIWVGTDLDAVLAPVYQLQNLLIGFMVAAIVLAVAIALINIRRMMQPLATLGDHSDKIIAGHYDEPVRKTGFQEIDELANKYQVMSKAIKEREQSILTSEQRFRELVNSLEGVVWEIDLANGRYLFVSQQLKDMLGYLPEQWLASAESHLNQIHPEDRERFQKNCRENLSAHKNIQCDYRIFSASGQVLWVRDLITVVSSNGDPRRLLGVTIDITKQRVLAEKLRESEENYRLLVENQSELVVKLDAEGRPLYASPSYVEMFGQEEKVLLNQRFDPLATAGTNPDDAKVKDSLEKPPHTVHFEQRAKTSLGWRWLAWSCKALLDDGGRVQQILAVGRDVTERKKTQEQMREAKERLQLVIDRMPIGCIVWTPDFRVALWNPAAEQIFGYSSQEMLGRQPYGYILSQEWRPAIDQIWKRLLEGDTTAHSENENLTKDGRTIVCSWFNTPLHHVSVSSFGAISMVQDVTEQKRTDQELEKYRTHLEVLVDERTKMLETAQAELVQAERLAVLGQLTATVSHEIRNPLGTVANALFLIRNELEALGSDAVERPLKLAERNVERCDNIISELLDFSRQRPLQKAELEIDRWLAELLDEMRWPESVEVRRELSASVIVSFDPERLRRAMVNVLDNALQSFDERLEVPRQVTICTRAVDARCEILVTDNGVGIPEDLMSRIFEPMFSTKSFGVGLGVPIVKNILEDHHGGVEYNSRPGHGTEVRLWLPLHGH